MTFRINANSCKNAMGTVFLLAAAFFVCSTLVSMRSVFADPIVDPNAAIQKSGRQSPRSSANNRTNVARTTTSRATTTTPASRAAVSRGTVASRNVAKRSVTPTRSNTVASRNVVSRNNSATNRTTNNRAIRARTATNPSRVSATGSVMSTGSRAVVGTSTNYSYLSSKLYTGSYANIIDSTTGLISADAYSNCLESYYTCMDEICTARSDTKGRCACAGRATNFLEAEQALERANEELIKLSGQLSLLIATKGKGKDLEAAFSLTDAEKVMNCVSYKENVQTGKMTETEWYAEHPTVTDTSGNIQTSGLPSYCKESGNTFGFDISRIDGSSSDILAQLQAWADAKDLAKEYTDDDSGLLVYKTNYLKNMVYDNLGLTVDGIASGEDVTLDSLANKWGYKLFEYAHNNVCGRVLDSCFNGIYEACGTPVTVKDSDGKTHNRCANGATSSCPFNYNSYISVKTSGNNEGDVELNERGSSNSTASTSASCFGYTTTTSSGTTVTSTRTVSSATSDPYYSLRGPVADARRSIMQKYLLDANSACDVYGNALKQTAQNINYQKIAAEQALQQKRLEFKQEAESTALAEASAAIDNFNECISEIWDCYEQYETEERWTTARVKAYCSQVSQVPHCYETMICSPLKTQLTAVIDMPDSKSCNNDNDFTKNTCRNVVTISEILYGTGTAALTEVTTSSTNSAAIREYCLSSALDCSDTDETSQYCLRKWRKSVDKTYNIYYYDGLTGNRYEGDVSPDEYSTADLPFNQVVTASNITKEHYTFGGWCPEANYSFANKTCEGYTPTNYIKLGASAVGDKNFYAIWNPETTNCTPNELSSRNATAGRKVWTGSGFSECEITACMNNYDLIDGDCE